MALVAPDAKMASLDFGAKLDAVLHFVEGAMGSALKAATLSALLGLSACHSEPPEKPVGNWASFNGFYPGMTLN
jgi:hypothetical protein